MSRADHPSNQDCCRTFTRYGPSGTPLRFHSFACRVSPNVQIHAPLAPRAEAASHAERGRTHDWRTCRLPDCEACDYTEAWLDQAYEQEGRR